MCDFCLNDHNFFTSSRIIFPKSASNILYKAPVWSSQGNNSVLYTAQAVQAEAPTVQGNTPL